MRGGHSTQQRLVGRQSFDCAEAKQGASEVSLDGGKDRPVTSPIDGKRGNQLMSLVASDQVHAPLPPSRFQGMAPLAGWRVAKPMIVAFIYPRLIEVDPMGRLEVRDLG